MFLENNFNKCIVFRIYKVCISDVIRPMSSALVLSSPAKGVPVLVF